MWKDLPISNGKEQLVEQEQYQNGIEALLSPSLVGKTI